VNDMPCPACGCGATSPAHAVAGLLLDDDVDAAIEAGLLQSAPCDACTPACAATLVDARATRLAALAARERFRLREARLARRAARRDAARRPAATAGAAPALPPAAAAALQRALARAKRD